MVLPRDVVGHTCIPSTQQAAGGKSHGLYGEFWQSGLHGDPVSRKQNTRTVDYQQDGHIVPYAVL